MNFKSLGLHESILEAIEPIGYDNPTPVQEQAIPAVIEGRDVIISAQTGTGKTAAFLLPIIHKIITEPHTPGIKAIIVTPTRELAVQISQQMSGFAYFANVSSIAVYGGGDGDSFSQERRALSEGVDIVICTVGRMISHLNMKYIDLSSMKYLVLDEADRMLDMGFYDDLMRIVSFIPKQRQTLLFSATMPFKIKEIAHKILHNPLEIILSNSKPPVKIIQKAYVVYDGQKIPLVKQILAEKHLQSIIIFCSTKLSVKQLSKDLRNMKLNIAEIHSDLQQNEREEALQNFKYKKINILIATDIVSRGIDIEDINLVINYDVPNDSEDYVHRIGRTARAETDGEAITFINEKGQLNFSKIEEMLEYQIEKCTVPESFGPTPTYNPKAKFNNPHRRNFNKTKSTLTKRRNNG